MYGGDDVLNTFVTGYVADALGKQGVTLNQVNITSTGDALNKVLGEKQAGRSTGGSVDAIWVNGENFATGVQANLWYCGWDKDLPNSSYVDFANPAVANDFGVPVKGCESAWQQANPALVYDSAKLTSADVASVSSLIGWAKAHPGHFTYPALPDFTGSMAVRTILYDTVGGATPLAGAVDEGKYGPAATKLWTRLNDLEPALWRGGSTYPQSQAAVEKLFSDGEISAFFTYGPGAVGEKVRTGLYPASTREAVPTPGNIANQLPVDPRQRGPQGRRPGPGEHSAGSADPARALHRRGDLPGHRRLQDRCGHAGEVCDRAAQPVGAAADRADPLLAP